MSLKIIHGRSRLSLLGSWTLVTPWRIRSYCAPTFISIPLSNSMGSIRVYPHRFSHVSVSRCNVFSDPLCKEVMNANLVCDWPLLQGNTLTKHIQTQAKKGGIQLDEEKLGPLFHIAPNARQFPRRTHPNKWRMQTLVAFVHFSKQEGKYLGAVTPIIVVVEQG